MPLPMPGVVRNLVRALGRFLPLAEARCCACGGLQALPVAEPGSALCPPCQAALAGQNATPCPGCGQYPPVPQPLATHCGDCRRTPRPWGHVYVFGPYEGALRELLLAYKFNQRLDLGRQLQECALAAFENGQRNHAALPRPDVIVPVPLHGRRLLRRGFNQSREIARLLARRIGAPIEQEALLRVRRTVPQMQLDRSERATNMLGAFAAEGALVQGRNILLVDDIMTTGSTLEECTKVLRASGASRVDILVLARA